MSVEKCEKMLAGEWCFCQPRNPMEALQYEDLRMKVSGEHYEIIKDGELVDQGTLQGDNRRIESDHGNIYIFDYLFTTGVYGVELCTQYVDGEKSSFIDIDKVMQDPMTEFSRFLEDPIELVDIVRSDEKNMVRHQLNMECHETYGYVSRGQEPSYHLEAEESSQFVDEIREILQKYELGKYPSSFYFNGDEPRTNCLQLKLKNRAGIFFCLKMKDNIPQEVELAAKEICDLYEKYEPEEHKNKKTASVVGKWHGEDLGHRLVEFEFAEDGSYSWSDDQCTQQGHYMLAGTQFYSTDLEDYWDRYDQHSRWKKVGPYSNLMFCIKYLKASIHVSDGSPIEVWYAREGCELPEGPMATSGSSVGMMNPDSMNMGRMGMGGMPMGSMNIGGMPMSGSVNSGGANMPGMSMGGMSTGGTTMGNINLGGMSLLEIMNQGGLMNMAVNQSQQSEEMVICPACGTRVKKAKFCGECGNKFP